MEKVVTIFQFKQENITELRTVLCNGEPWFAAADVCKVLDIANVSDAVEKLDEDEKNTIALSDGNRGNPNILIVKASAASQLVAKQQQLLQENMQTLQETVQQLLLPATAHRLQIEEPSQIEER